MNVLLPVLDRGINIAILQPLANGGLDSVENFLSITDHFLACINQRSIAHRIGGLDRQVQQFMAHLEYSEPIRDGRVNIHGFAGDTATLVRWHGIECAHVVQAIGKLDDDDTNILDHRQHHLAEVLRLGLGLAAKVDLCQFADTIDQFRHLVTELGGNLLLERRRILDHVVQDRGDNTSAVHAHFGEYARDRNRVTDIRFARNPALTLVGRSTHQVSPVDFLDLSRLEIGIELAAQFGYTGYIIAGTNVPGNDFEQIGVIRPHHSPVNLKNNKLMEFYNTFTRRWAQYKKRPRKRPFRVFKLA